MSVNKGRVAELYVEGVKLEAIGAELGCSRQRVEQIARLFGLPGRTRTRKPAPAPKIGKLGRVALEQRNEHILALYAEGRPYKHIASVVGCPLTTVKGVLDRHAPARLRERAA